jgi:putative FmdB family regulatory protein
MRLMHTRAGYVMIVPHANPGDDTMPIYEYRCDACSGSFEKFQRSAGGDGTAPCPNCGATANRKLSMFAAPRGASPETGHPEAPPPPADMGGHGHSHGPGGHSHSHGPGGHSH